MNTDSLDQKNPNLIDFDFQTDNNSTGDIIRHLASI